MAWWREWVGKRRERPVDADGFGQGFLEDLRFLRRFRRCRTLVVAWERPTVEDREAQAGHAVIGRFGDDAYAVAEVGGERWIVRERDFHGWPEPPRYVFFACGRDGIRVARDFDAWPRGWRRPEARPPG